MKKITLVAALSVSTLALSAGQSFADYTLSILHINDLHSRIQSINASDATCSDEDETAGECFGGVARVATKINERRDAISGEGGNVIVLDAGDQFMGSLFYTTYKGEDAVEFMNMIGFDAMAVGNHEFDDGPSILADFIDAAEFPVISGNTVVADADEDLAGKIEEWTVVEQGGERIGILSVLATDTDVTSSPGPNVTFEDEIEYLQDAVSRMEGEGINKIVLLSHVGFVRDQEIAAAVDGIDVIVGGHSHTLFSNTEEGAEAYPTMVANPSGTEVPIVSAYAYSKYVGEIEITFDDEGNVTAATGDTILLDNSVEPDETVAARVTELAAPIEELMAQNVAEVTAAVDGSRETCRAAECTMGNLVADAMLDRTADQGVQVVIQNGGGLRASIDAGEVTMGEIISVLPFQNTLATFELSGADIIASLEHGVSGIEEVAGRFPQVAGIRYSFDPNGPANEGRIQSVEIEENGEWSALDEGATYLVATNNFMRNGGDGYALFAENAENAYDYGPGLEVVLADYLRENSPYEPALDGRITDVSADAPTEAAVEEEAPTDASQATEPSAEELTTPAPAEEAAPIEEAPASTEEQATEAPVTGDQDVVSEPVAPVEEPATDAPAAPEPTEAPVTPEAGETDEAAPIEEEAPVDEAAPIEPAAPATDEAAPIEEAGPADEAAPIEDAAAPQTHTVVNGDNLWNLAEQYLGNGERWPEIAEANPELRNPNRLHVGQELTIPAN
ncbi:LysM peptidoglycan-binding domain-containing protein [Aliihoeflea aestuarii]|uniref:5'-nucleotidase C-terminal domain-containing protein n=1 Tax=Aliihoeflea aestuarii TaxID=453840 RepID=UPI002093D3FC|nr:5'-nucleotidase C-terminal domain-containing protein [Aliihoeflea aestuarii]MCO6391930.1 LysM peptidoglycan-binding domain-containing protein [Aliihoeflea aestuarii]